MAVPSSAHSQPTEEERGAQRAAALSQQRATAAAAQVAQPEYGPAFPRKDPAKQPPLVAGARMIDIRVGHPTVLAVLSTEWTQFSRSLS